MNDGSEVHVFEPIELECGCTHSAYSTPEDARTGSNPGEKSLGLLALNEEERPKAVWAIKDLAERARALDAKVPLSCEDPEWVALIRSVNDPAAGKLGADLQTRIGSERAWGEGRRRWDRKMKEFQKSIDQEWRDFKGFEELFNRLTSMSHLFLTKQEYYQKSLEDWVCDFDQPPNPAPTTEEIARSRRESVKIGNTWLASIKADETSLNLMRLDYKLDFEDFDSYRSLNLALTHRGNSKMTRAEFWAKRGRRFNPTRLSLYRALLGELAFPAAVSD